MRLNKFVSLKTICVSLLVLMSSLIYSQGEIPRIHKVSEPISDATAIQNGTSPLLPFSVTEVSATTLTAEAESYVHLYLDSNEQTLRPYQFTIDSVFVFSSISI